MEKIKFKKGNEIPYGQDVDSHKGLPTDVIFQIENRSNYYTLRADGYGFGVTGHPIGKYGNGSIIVTKDDLIKHKHGWFNIDDIQSTQYEPLNKNVVHIIQVNKTDVRNHSFTFATQGCIDKMPGLSQGTFCETKHIKSGVEGLKEADEKSINWVINQWHYSSIYKNIEDIMEVLQGKLNKNKDKWLGTKEVKDD